MKNVWLAFFGLLIMNSCSQESANYVTLQGKLQNNKDSIITIANRQGVIKEIKINEKGEFKDTLTLASDKGEIYSFFTSPQKEAPIFLRNGFDIKIVGDANDFLNSFTYSGKGSVNNNFIKAQIQKNQSMRYLTQSILDLEETAFNKRIDGLKREYDSLLNSYQNLDSTLYQGMQAQNNQMVSYFKNAYQTNLIMGKGKPAPTFENYVSFNGGTKSLSDFKGKYVYIDVWATWCGPCIVQFPYLKELKKEYKNKKIAFIGISTDESRRSGGSWDAAKQKWKNFVKDKKLDGYQLWAGEDFSFQQAYQINSIPRFILIDPEGNIFDANAPRPSDPALKELLNSLDI